MLTGPSLVAAALLVLAGAQKLIDPSMTSGALKALRLPSSPTLVRMGAAVELAIGAVALVVRGGATWWLVCLSYLAFAAFVSAALRSGTMLGSCGCFGREETPPHSSHVVLNVGLALVSGIVAVRAPTSVIDAIAAHPGEGAALTAVAVLVVGLLYAAYVDLPRALRARPSDR
ncbi:MAG: MauE/DoxX family redox-associated membrane protein [Acidimicrobiales bacterium]